MKFTIAVLSQAASALHSARAGGEVVIRTASLSACNMHRHTLGRQWGPNANHRLVWVMLNPSTADAEIDDPTIRRCIGFSQREGYDALTVVNLFSVRSSEPSILTRAWPRNDEAADTLLHDATRQSDCIAAWGAWASRDFVRARSIEVVGFASARSWRCLGTTKDGHPKHPLYVKSDSPLIPFP